MPQTAPYSTALLVFANSSNEELRHKKIARGAVLFDTLTDRTLQIAKKSGLPYFHSDESQQMGNSFGDRFVNAIQMVLCQGFDSIITIGNDTPQLKLAHILDAVTELKVGNCVLGPSLDGGFYMMGLQKGQFDYAHFLQLPWQTPHLKEQVRQWLQKTASKCVQFEPFNDIDCFRDIEVLAKLTTRLHEDLILLLVSLINLQVEIGCIPSMIFDFSQTSMQFNKGSPL